MKLFFNFKLLTKIFKNFKMFLAYLALVKIFTCCI